MCLTVSKQTTGQKYCIRDNDNIGIGTKPLNEIRQQVDKCCISAFTINYAELLDGLRIVGNCLYSLKNNAQQKVQKHKLNHKLLLKEQAHTHNRLKVYKALLPQIILIKNGRYSNFFQDRCIICLLAILEHDICNSRGISNLVSVTEKHKLQTTRFFIFSFDNQIL